MRHQHETLPACARVTQCSTGELIQRLHYCSSLHCLAVLSDMHANQNSTVSCFFAVGAVGAACVSHL